ncbi:MAG TPA: hypothetical protein VFI95_04610 [Terriglobales bacterium]|nr:hypothetical protein [Terriglobales bacterium]
MKVMFTLAVLLFATAAFTQTAPVLYGDAHPVQVPSHPEHASVHDLAAPAYILGGAGVEFARGVRPLWEVAGERDAMPLGDVARMLRKEREAKKKAEKVLSDQL